MKKRFTEEQILDFLKQAEAGVPVKELCRRYGFSDASFYTWRAKFSGMTVPDAKRLKDLELENSRLKKLLAEAHLDIEALKVVARGKGKPDSSTGSSAGDAGSNRHLPAPCLSSDRAISLGAALSTPRQRAKHQAANPTRGTGTGAPAFRLSAPAYPAAARWRAGQPQADLSSAGLMVKRRRRRHGVAIERERLSLPSAPNQVWSMDFVFDALSTGRRIKCLTVADDFTKEAEGVRNFV